MPTMTTELSFPTCKVTNSVVYIRREFDLREF